MKLLAKYYDDIWKYRDDLEIVSEYLKKIEGDLLDLGCATGRVLQVAKDKNFQAFGVDDSIDMVNKANEEFAKCQNIKAFKGNFVQFDKCIDDKPLAVITCLANTFSMLRNPDDRARVIEKCSKRLLVSGYLIIWNVNDNKSEDFVNEQFLPDGTRYYAEVSKDYSEMICKIDINLSNKKIDKTYKFKTSLIPVEEMIDMAKQNNLMLDKLWGDLIKSEYHKQNSQFQFFVFKKEK